MGQVSAINCNTPSDLALTPLPALHMLSSTSCTSSQGHPRKDSVLRPLTGLGIEWPLHEQLRGAGTGIHPQTGSLEEKEISPSSLPLTPPHCTLCDNATPKLCDLMEVT